MEPVFASCFPDSILCERDLNIAVFFDGTGNNEKWTEQDECSPGLGMTQRQFRKDSNVARLFRAFPVRPSLGYYPLYVEGPGTPCEPIGEIVPLWSGMAFGGGGDGRINHGLLHVLNSIHRSITPDSEPIYHRAVVTALCRNGFRTINRHTLRPNPLASRSDELPLAAVGMEDIGGLLCDASGKRDHARRFLQEQTQWLAKKIEATAKPKLVDVNIDVFGFSRGAAQARVFCQWLSELMPDGRLCGVPARIRFLGIFDTVASVGLANRSTVVGDQTNGHLDWAQPEYLRIAPGVKKCVHYVAMHENRASFPLESVRLPNGTMPANCQQYALPGMHSDVGGGYEPNAQGRSPNQDDSDKLSQIPLELMYHAALGSGVPLDKDQALDALGDTPYNPFAVHPDLRKAYDAYVATSPRLQGTPAQWLLPYLAWRYQVRHVYTTSMSWAKRASPEDLKDLEGANATLLADIAALDTHSKEWSLADRQRLHSFAMVEQFMKLKATQVRHLAPGAAAVLGNLRAQPVLASSADPEHGSPQAYLFANYVHDSFAGFKPFDTKISLVGCRDFIPGTWEPEGYLRYRRFYIGDNTPQTAALPAPEPSETQPLTEEHKAQINQLRHNVDMGKQFF
jgi:hypothetical protein